MRSAFALALLCLLGIFELAAPAPQLPGQKADGFLLFNGWKLAPAGMQVPLPDTLPMTAVLHPDGRHLFLLCAGYTQPAVIILDPANPGRAEDTEHIMLDGAWLGLAISPDGEHFYVPKANLGTVQEFTFTETKPPAPPVAEGERPKPAPRGQIEAKPAREFKLFQGIRDPNARGSAKYVRTNFLGDAAVHPDGKRLYVTDLQANLIYEIGLDKGAITREIAVGVRPYRILPSKDGTRLYVSNWGGGSISVIDTATGSVRETWTTGAHPSDMLLDSRGRLYVACANTNAVYVLDTQTGHAIEQISVAMTPRSPLGSTPNALALAPDESHLYVANADNNAVAVVTLGSESKVTGFIPAGWYPTALRLSADGHRLFVANGHGLRSYPNLKGPQPTNTERSQFVGRMQKGSLSIIDVPNEAELAILTRRTLANSPYRDELLENAGGSGSVIPTKPGGASPIKHVIYIIKENRTYDQFLGDMKEGNGDPSLVLFGEANTPNHHKICREFVLLDNFYVNADVSADGHQWSMGALANDFTNKLWPSNYGGRRPQYDSEGEDPISTPPGGLLFNAALKAHVSLRVYGEWMQNPKDPSQPVTPRAKELEGYYDPKYRSFDLDYHDQKRMDEWLREFAEFEKNGNLPALEIVRLPNDHTNYLKAGAFTPRALVADNDLALGRMIEALSKSRYWQDTAVFVLEDDAQNGPDHVDSHRSPGLVISSWVKRGSVDSTMYSTVSMLRTIELILGMAPMTQYDAGATPMFAAFADKPDLKPYSLVKPGIDLEERNPAGTPGAQQSSRLDSSEADLVDDDEGNVILWRAIKGDQPMPAPVRSAFPYVKGR